MENVKTKVCTKCGEEKPFSEYSKQKYGKYGYTSRCKQCRRLEGRLYKQQHLEEIHKKNKIYREKNHEEILRKCAEYRKNNRELLKQKNKEYHKVHKEQERKYRRKYKTEITRPYCEKGRDCEIENYDIAKAEDFVNWDRHHRLETHNSDGEKRLVQLSQKELMALDMYYNRPPEELLYVRHNEHSAMHIGKR